MENKNIIIILLVLLASSTLYGLYQHANLKVIEDGKDIQQESCCEHSNFYNVDVGALDYEDINDKVVDYYVEEKKLSEFYYDKICRDILEVRLNETLSKNPNFWMSVYSYYYGYSELRCEYQIYWGERGDFYGNQIEVDDIRINKTDFLLATENRPPKFNESLVIADWDDEIHETKIRNDNPDYNILVNVKINETYARW